MLDVGNYYHSDGAKWKSIQSLQAGQELSLNNFPRS
jgi:hypothetical protein